MGSNWVCLGKNTGSDKTTESLPHFLAVSWSYLLLDALHDMAALLLDGAANIGGLCPQPHTAGRVQVFPLLEATAREIHVKYRAGLPYGR